MTQKNRRQFLKQSTLALLAGPACAAAQDNRLPSDRPNIILIYTDDQGFADLSAQEILDDIRTPHIDAIAADGIRCTAGYVTAPQCAPSRAALLTGRYQQRYDFGHIGKGPLPLDEKTLADYLRQAGYATGQVGKWHLDPNAACVEWGKQNVEGFQGGRRVPLTWEHTLPYQPEKRGFDDVFQGEYQRYWANFHLPEGETGNQPRRVTHQGYRVDIQTEAALEFIERHPRRPFFLYLAYMAPHVPLEATEKYLSRFPGPMPERRRYALAMLSAIDDGVGRIRRALEEKGLYENTLFFFISDNGAPLLAHTRELPISYRGGAWDGSLNDPWHGEKGMLMEGGIRVPFCITWKDRLPTGRVWKQPVSTLDVLPTCLAAANLPMPDNIDGLNLLPILDGMQPMPERALFWRFWGQAAIRRGRWKLIHLADDRRLLYDLESPEHEGRDLASENPEKTEALYHELKTWADQLQPPGLRQSGLMEPEEKWYEQHAGLQFDKQQSK